jgi:transposase
VPLAAPWSRRSWPARTIPRSLADLAKGRLRQKLPALRAALEGHFRSHHALIAGEILAHIDYLDEAIARLSVEVERKIAPFSEAVTLLDTIPGVDQRTAETLVAETGADMARFPGAAHLASWAGICPGNNESAGKHGVGRMRKGSKWLRSALVEAAESAAGSRASYLRSQYTRLKGRRGHKKAIVAVAHSILVMSYHMLKRREGYRDLGVDYLLLRDRTDAYKNRLVRQLERLGHKVTLEPLSATA